MTMSNPKKILIIDDNRDILEVLGIILRTAGYEVEQHDNGAPLATLAERNEYPDLIILDVLLSGHDGRDLCHNIKDDPITEKIPVIMISAYPTAARTAKEAGANIFLQKPFSMNDLLAAVEQLLAV
jgi:CheY-like chemotaxis protein